MRPLPVLKQVYGTVATGALSLAAFVALWHGAVVFFDVSPYTLPSPLRVAGLGWQKRFLAEDVALSTLRVSVGFLMATVVAVPLGLVMGVSQRLRKVLNPIVSLIRPLPSMSWIPLSIIWFGLGEQQKYYIVFMGSITPILVYTIEATLQVEEPLRLAARNLGASTPQLVFKVIFPAALPNIMAGLKVVLAIAWTCVISAEMIGTNSGLGFSILHGKDIGATDMVFLGMLCISLSVLVLDVLFRALEWVLLPHRRGRR